MAAAVSTLSQHVRHETRRTDRPDRCRCIGAEVTVKVPRFRIAWTMGFVALVALDFAAMRAALGRSDRFNEEWLMGALPMANALVAGLLIGYRRRRCNRLQFGFQAFGATALSLYIAGMWLYPDMTGLHFRLFTEPHGHFSDTIRMVIWDSFPLVMIGVSNFGFALFGGFLFRNFRIG
jgi:hypothetical protein